MTKTQKQNAVILARLIELSNNDKDFATMLANDLDTILDEYVDADVFGTEAQLDPRGDVR